MSEPPSRRAIGLVAQREIGSYGMSDPRLPDWPAGLSEPLAAKYLGISQTTLRALQAKGEIAKIAITKGRFVYRRVDLDRFLANLAGEEQHEEVNEWEKA